MATAGMAGAHPFDNAIRASSVGDPGQDEQDFYRGDTDNGDSGSIILVFDAVPTDGTDWGLRIVTVRNDTGMGTDNNAGLFVSMNNDDDWVSLGELTNERIRTLDFSASGVTLANYVKFVADGGAYIGSVMGIHPVPAAVWPQAFLALSG